APADLRRRHVLVARLRRLWDLAKRVRAAARLVGNVAEPGLFQSRTRRRLQAGVHLRATATRVAAGTDRSYLDHGAGDPWDARRIHGWGELPREALSGERRPQRVDDGV